MSSSYLILSLIYILGGMALEEVELYASGSVTFCEDLLLVRGTSLYNVQETSCNFENNLCPAYYHDSRSDFNWTVYSGETPSPNTGPTGDHTVGKQGRGYYAYIESSNRLKGERARISSHWIQHPDPTVHLCMTLYYHMSGHTIGRLEVSMMEIANMTERILFRLQGDQLASDWQLASIVILAKSNFKVMIDGFTSHSFYGDIAIDDIEIKALSRHQRCTFWPPHASFKGQKPIPRAANIPAQPKCGVRPIDPRALSNHLLTSNDIIPLRWSASNPLPAGRVVGGRPAPESSWPWMAMVKELVNGQWLHACGGSLLDANWVVTAAHCVSDIILRDNIIIRLGSEDMMNTEATVQEIYIENLYIHPEYKVFKRWNNDIAMLKLRHPAKVTSHVDTICMPGTQSGFSQGSKCQIAGWGKLEDSDKDLFPQKLQEGEVQLISQEACRHSHPGAITDSMFCAGDATGKVDSCTKDSGGPLICEKDGRWHLVGITSWGDGCGKPNKYGVYTNVTELHWWIDSVRVCPQFHEPAYKVNVGLPRLAKAGYLGEPGWLAGTAKC